MLQGHPLPRVPEEVTDVAILSLEGGQTLTKRLAAGKPLKQPEWRAKAKALLLSGQSMAQVAEQVGVSRQAVYKFYDANRAELDAQRQEAADLVRDASIREKAQRIRNADVVVTKIMEWIAAHGLADEVTRRTDAGEVQVDRRFNRGIVSALKEMQAYVADELGEMPKAGVNFNLSNVTNTAVLDMSNFSPADKAKVLLMALETYRRPA